MPANLCRPRKATVTTHIQANIPDDDGLVGECSFFSSLLGCKDESGQPWSRERVSYAGLLFTWASHYEIIALIGDVIYMLAKHPDVIDKAREEAVVCTAIPHFNPRRPKSTRKWHVHAHGARVLAVRCAMRPGHLISTLPLV